MTALRAIDASTACRLLAEDRAILLDVREPDEHARERIPQATSLPLSRLERTPPVEAGGKLVILHCRSGARTAANAARLAGAVHGEAAILEGGLEAWKRAGLPTDVDRRRPIEVMRQVQIAAGSLVLLGTLLGALVSPWFLLLSGFVGGGLVLAGITGWCGMARLLALAPWNRTRAHAAPPAAAVAT
jgi:rhodanese-related sulfurtransferase